MAPEDQAKMTFITTWGVFVCTVMWFGFRNAPSTFQRDMSEIFGPFLIDFMRIFLDDLSVFGSREKHLEHLRLCLRRCCEVSFSLLSAPLRFEVANFWGTLSHRKALQWTQTK